MSKRSEALEIASRSIILDPKAVKLARLAMMTIGTGKPFGDKLHAFTQTYLFMVQNPDWRPWGNDD